MNFVVLCNTTTTTTTTAPTKQWKPEVLFYQRNPGNNAK